MFNFFTFRLFSLHLKAGGFRHPEGAKPNYFFIFMLVIVVPCKPRPPMSSF
jgi:hypothetical protein